MTSKITAYEYPNFFVDEMQKGVFKSMYHLHHFEWNGDKTIMTDDFQFKSPLGLLGKIADVVFLKNYLTQFLLERNQMIKQYAEGNEWQSLIS